MHSSIRHFNLNPLFSLFFLVIRFFLYPSHSLSILSHFPIQFSFPSQSLLTPICMSIFPSLYSSSFLSSFSLPLASLTPFFPFYPSHFLFLFPSRLPVPPNLSPGGGVSGPVSKLSTLSLRKQASETQRGSSNAHTHN